MTVTYLYKERNLKFEYLEYSESWRNMCNNFKNLTFLATF